MGVFDRSQLEADAKAAAEAYGITTTDPTGRGNGDQRDAFRHAYTSAVLKNYFMTNAGHDDITATAYALAGGMAVEIRSGENYKSTSFGDYNQDLWNDNAGANYDPASGLTPAQYVKQLLDSGQLIETKVEAGQGGRIAQDPSSYFLQGVGAVRDGFSNLNNAIKEAVGDLFGLHSGDALDASNKLGGVVSDPSKVHVITKTEGLSLSFVSSDVTITKDTSTYFLNDVLTSAEEAAAAAADFVQDQVSAGIDWFSNNSSGLQLDFANWLAGNLGALLDGTTDLDDAFVDLVEYIAIQRVSGYVTGSISTVTGAQSVLKEIYTAAGVTDAALATKMAGSTYTALTRIATDFLLNSSGWNTQQYVASGLTTIASVIAFEYGADLFTSYGLNAGGAATAATTLVSGLINSGNYNTGDWINLGAQVGLAYGAYVGGAAIGNALLGPSAATGNPVAIVAAAVITLFGSKILGGLFGGKKSFGPGEFPSPQALYNSIYQVQTITVNGQQVPALVAVNNLGSTIVASGNNIGYIVGNVGSDVLVGSDTVQTITGNGGADYLEANGGADNLIGGNGADHLNGGTGDDILQGDAGNDIAFGDAGNDIALGGDGGDFIHLGGGADVASGGAGNDYILAAGGDDAVSGDTGNDSIDGGYGDDSIDGGDGNDLVLGNIGNDYIEGGDGSDTLFGDVGNDQIYGGNGNDFIDGGAGVDILHGDAGRDIVLGGAGDDFIDGGLGDDNLLGGLGNDVILGGLDNDYIKGEDGNDSISGGFGDDILVGGNGINTLEGGEGNDAYVIGDDVNEHDSIIVDNGLAGDVDTILLSWLSTANAQAGVNLLKSGDDLVVSYNSRVLATITGQFVAGNAIEKIELSGGGYIDLNAVSYDLVTHLGAFTVNPTPLDSVLASVETREDEVLDNILSKELYWNNTFLNKLSQVAYDEQLSDQTVYTYYNGTQFETSKRSQGKFGGKYSVYKLAQPGSIAGTNFVSLEYAIQDAEDQAAASPFGNDQLTMAGPYESLINGAVVVYSTFSSHNIQDIVINGTVVSTKVAGDSANYTAGATVYGATYAQRVAAGTSVVTDVAVKKYGSDLLVGAYWNEYIDGKSGDDVLVGNDGNDGLIGGDGNDWGFGGDGNDTLVGDGGDDVLFGSDGNDSILGGAGDDALIGGDGADTISGDDGSDWIDAGDGIDSVIGGSGDDLIMGGTGDDYLNGGAGDDIIHGDDGNDAIIGGAGDDTLIGGLGNDSIYGGEGNDVINGNGGAILLNGNDGQDVIVFSAATAAITANLETNTFGGSAAGLVISNFEHVVGSSYNDTIFSGSIANNMDGGDGLDTLSYIDSTGAVSVNLGTGVYAGGYAAGDVLSNIENITGSNWNDTIVGNSINNVLNGGGGNDTLNGGGGADTLVGGIGADLFAIANTATSVTITDFVQGTDKVDLSSFIYADALNDLVITQVGADTTISVPRITGNPIVTLSGVTASTLGASDFIFNTSPHYTLNGTAGADVVTVSIAETYSANIAGFDYAQGDRIDITAYGASVTDKSQITIVQVGADTALAFPTTEGNSATLKLLGITASSISNAYFLSNTINYGAGVNASYGAGNDSVNGSIGNDTIWGNGGNDTVNGGLNGATGNDQIIGMAGNDYLYGGYGNDSITADGASEWNTLGNDYLEGGAGDDQLLPGPGNDTVYGGNGNDVIAVYENAWAYGDSLYGGDGNDYFATSGSSDLIYGDSVAEGAGNGNDTIYANGGNDTIYGGGGNDLIEGGPGNDTIYGGSGRDTASFYYATIGATFNLANSASNAGAAVGDVTYDVEDIKGSAYNDILTGDVGANYIIGLAGADSIVGGAGNDTLDGDVGNDTMVGGADDDAYVVDSASDVIIENAAEGNDSVTAYATYSLGANIESITLAGSSAINATGNASNNTLMGNSANNILDGGVGNDTMVGGAGNDSYIVDSAADVVTENTNGGIDSVTSTVTYALVNNVENLTLGGSAAINGTGNILNNVLTGNSGNNILDGGEGSDTMIGGAGSDSYFVSTSSDVVTENVNEGSDTVTSSITYELAANLENLVLTGSALLQGTGNTLNNVITGNTGSNILSGNDGADTLFGGDGADTLYGDSGNDSLSGDNGNDWLEGGLGNDTLTGGAGNDSFIIGLAAAATTISDFVHGTDKIDLGAYGYVDGFSDLTIAQAGANTTINIPRPGGNNVVTLLGITATMLDANDFVFNAIPHYTLATTSGADILTVSTAETYTAHAVGFNFSQGDRIDIAAYGTMVSDKSQITINQVGSDTVLIFPAVGGKTATITLEGVTASSITNSYFLSNTINYGAGVNSSYGAGNDSVNGSLGNDTIWGNGGNDTVTGATGNDQIIGMAGNDYLYGGYGNDSITADGASEFNTVGNDLLDGGAGNDQLLPGPGNDTIYGGDGNDLVSVYENVVAYGDTVYGGNGDDGLYLSGSSDLVYGDDLTEGTGDGNDIIQARGGNDTIYGGGGNDSIDGGAGNDSMIGGAGIDALTGGLGSELFIYNVVTDSGIGVGNRDILIDFNQAQGDRIGLSAFTGTFAFLGTAAFTGGVNPEARFFDDGTNTIVQVDTNHDNVVDFEVQINGHATLVSGDFVL